MFQSWSLEKLRRKCQSPLHDLGAYYTDGTLFVAAGPDMHNLVFQCRMEYWLARELCAELDINLTGF